MRTNPYDLPTWEWLHIVAHSLGGNNEVGNLVAGLFEANTRMIPHEREIQRLSNLSNLVTVNYEIDVFPNSWVAIGIKMSNAAIVPGEGFVHRSHISASSDLNCDKLQYDLWRY